MIAGGGVTLASALALCGAATEALRVSIRGVRASIDHLVERDSREYRPPERAVLVLHDTPSTRDALAALLASELRVPVLTASTVAEATVAMRSRPRVIVADYHLGGDVTSARFLHARPAATRAVIVTGATDADSLASIARAVDARVQVLATPVTDAECDALVARVRADLDAA